MTNETKTNNSDYAGELMNAYETAEFLHISYWHLMDLVRRKKIPHIRFSKRVFFRVASLEKFIDELEAGSVE